MKPIRLKEGYTIELSNGFLGLVHYDCTSDKDGSSVTAGAISRYNYASDGAHRKAIARACRRAIRLLQDKEAEEGQKIIARACRRAIRLLQDKEAEEGQKIKICANVVRILVGRAGGYSLNEFVTPSAVVAFTKRHPEIFPAPWTLKEAKWALDNPKALLWVGE